MLESSAKSSSCVLNEIVTGAMSRAHTILDSHPLVFLELGPHLCTSLLKTLQKCLANQPAIDSKLDSYDSHSCQRGRGCSMAKLSQQNGPWGCSGSMAGKLDDATIICLAGCIIKPWTAGHSSRT